MTGKLTVIYSEIRRQRDILVTGAVVNGVDATLAGRLADDLAFELAQVITGDCFCAECGKSEFIVAREPDGDRLEVRISRGCDCR